MGDDSVSAPDHDIQLLLQARKHGLAFDRLVERYESKVYRMTLAYLRNNTGLAEEVTQDIFLKLWQALPSYEVGRAAIGTWLYTIARNTCLSSIRREELRRHEPLSPDGHERASAQAEIHPQSETLRLSIEQLPEMQRVVITLFYLQEKQIDEVSRMLGIPAGTVKSHLHRARLALGEKMRTAT